MKRELVFRAKRKIGSGTYGEVYEAEDTATGDVVALKVSKHDEAYRASALTEVRILQQLQDVRCVVNYVCHFETSERRIVIATEKWGCNTLEAIRHEGCSPLPLYAVRTVCRSVLEALRELNLRGYMHCDIKPENVMLRGVREFDEVCVIDFGCARKFFQNQYFDVQSMWYRSPEVLCCYPYTAKMDIWSVGCMLYELHTGHALFTGASTSGQLQLIVEIFGKPPAACRASLQRHNPSLHMLLAGYADVTRSTMRCELRSKFEKHRAGAVNDMSDIVHRDSFIDFLCALLQVDPENRVTADEALLLPFMSLGESDVQCATTVTPLRSCDSAAPSGVDTASAVALSPQSAQRRSAGASQPFDWDESVPPCDSMCDNAIHGDHVESGLTARDVKPARVVLNENSDDEYRVASNFFCNASSSGSRPGEREPFDEYDETSDDEETTASS